MKFAILFLSVCVCVCITSHSAISWCSRAYLQKEVTAVWKMRCRLWQNEFWIKERRNYWSDQLLWLLCVENTSIKTVIYHFLFTFLLCDSFPLVIHRHNSVFFLLSLWLCPLQFYLLSMFFVYHPVPEILCFVWQSTTTPYVFVCFSRFPYRMIKREWQLSCFREQAFVISFPFPSFLSLVSCCKLPPPSSTWKCTHTHKEFEMLHKQAHTILFSTHMQMLFEHKQKHTNTMQVHEFHRNSCKHPLIQPCSGDLHIQQINIRRYTSTCKYNI